MSDNTQAPESNREFSPQEADKIWKNATQGIDIDNHRENVAQLQEIADPTRGSDLDYTQETNEDVEYDQSFLGDMTDGIWNSLIVGTAEGLANLLPTISNAIYETEFANDWIKNVSSFADKFEATYSDDYYKPIESIGDINASHFWAGLGNGIGFVMGIGKFAKGAQMLTKSGKALSRAQKAVNGVSNTNKAFSKAGKAGKAVSEGLGKTGKALNKGLGKFGRKNSKTAGVVNKTDDIATRLAGADKATKLRYLNSVAQRSESTLQNSARIGSFLGGTAMMYGAVQEEALEAGLSPTHAARFALGVSGLVSMTEGAALEWIGKIPARAAQKALIKKGSKKAFKDWAKNKTTPQQMMKLFEREWADGLKSGALVIGEGVAVEAGQEFGQTYIEESAKQFYDQVFADEQAKKGEGKFGKEVFDTEAFKRGDIWEGLTGGADSKESFTQSLFAAFLGGIIGGGMAGMNINHITGERNLANETMFGVVAADVRNGNTQNIDNLESQLKKAVQSKEISQADYDSAMETINEMETFAKNNKSVLYKTDGVQQYQMYNYKKTAEKFQSKIVNDIEASEKYQQATTQAEKDIIKSTTEKKNKLYEGVIQRVNEDYLRLAVSEEAETKDAVEFNDKILAYNVVNENIENGTIQNEKQLKEALDEIGQSFIEEQEETIKKAFTKAEEGKTEETEETSDTSESTEEDGESESSTTTETKTEKEEETKPTKEPSTPEIKLTKEQETKLKEAFEIETVEDANGVLQKLVNDLKETEDNYEKNVLLNQLKEVTALRDSLAKEETTKKKEETSEVDKKKLKINEMTKEQLEDVLANPMDYAGSEAMATIRVNQAKKRLAEIEASDKSESGKSGKSGKVETKTVGGVDSIQSLSKGSSAITDVSNVENVFNLKENSDGNYEVEFNESTEMGAFVLNNPDLYLDPKQLFLHKNKPVRGGGVKITKPLIVDKKGNVVQKGEIEFTNEKSLKNDIQETTETTESSEETGLQKMGRLSKTPVADLSIEELEEIQGNTGIYGKKSAEAKEELKKRRAPKEKNIPRTFTSMSALKKAEAESKKGGEVISEEELQTTYELAKENAKQGKKRAQNQRLVEYIEEKYPELRNESTKETSEKASDKQETGKDEQEEINEEKVLDEADVATSNEEIDNIGETEEQLAAKKKKASEANKQAEQNKQGILNLFGGNTNTTKSQRENVASTNDQNSKIADNIELFNKIKGHFMKMFPSIPVKQVEKLFDNHGVEILGEVSKRGITISDEALQSTLVHEYAHVYLDMIADKEIVKVALGFIESTQYFRDAQIAYPNSTVEEQKMEALVQAMAENAVPKLEEKLQGNKLQQWFSVAKKLWRAVKRLFTGVTADNYIDYLSDQLAFSSKPQSVDTSYLNDNVQYQRQTVARDVVDFNQSLSKLVGQLKISAILTGQTNFSSEGVIQTMITGLSINQDILPKAVKNVISQLEENNPIVQSKKVTTKESVLNDQWQEEIQEFSEVVEKRYNELSPEEKLKYALENTTYNVPSNTIGVDYYTHLKIVAESLTAISNKAVKESAIDEAFVQDENTDEKKSVEEKNSVKADKQMSLAVQSIIAGIVTKEGNKIHQDLTFNYIVNVVAKSKSVQDLKRNIFNDGKNNEIALGLSNILTGAKELQDMLNDGKGDNDPQIDVVQSLVMQMNSLASTKQTAVDLNEEGGTKTLRERNVSASRLVNESISRLKNVAKSQMFLNNSINLKGSSFAIKELFSKLENRFRFSLADVNGIEAGQLNRIADGVFGLNEGDFDVVQYAEWFASKKNLQGEMKHMADVFNATTESAKRSKYAAEIFGVQLMNTIAEQNKIKNKEGRIVQGAVGYFKDYIGEHHNDGIENANTFINSSGNTVSTIRLGSYVDRTLKNIRNRIAPAVKKWNSTIKHNGKEVFLYRNNPIFKKIYNDQTYSFQVDDAINNIVNDRVSEHNAQNAVDLALAQLIRFANNQSKGTYNQKGIINDRSHSNFINAERHSKARLNTILQDQSQVDEALMNKKFNDLKEKFPEKFDTQEKIDAFLEEYINEFNNISLNVAYVKDGEIKVEAFNTEYMESQDNITNEDAKQGLLDTLSQLRTDNENLVKALKNADLIQAIQKDHVGLNQLYNSLNDLIEHHLLNDRVNRIAFNDITSEPIPYRLIKGSKVDGANIIKRNSGMDSTGVKVELKRPVKTFVFEMVDENDEAISNSFLFRSESMTNEINEALGSLDTMSHNSKDGEYMVDENGNNIYHKNSSLNHVKQRDENGKVIANNLEEIAEAMGDKENSRFYKIAQMLEMLEKQYPDHNIQITDVESIKGTAQYEVAGDIDEMYDAISNGNFSEVEANSYEYSSENFYIPFNENKDVSKKDIDAQVARLSTQMVKILTNLATTRESSAQANELQRLLVEIAQEQMGIGITTSKDGATKQEYEANGSVDYRYSKLGDLLFMTDKILAELEGQLNEVQDPDMIELLKEIRAYNAQEGKKLNNARKEIAKLKKQYGDIKSVPDTEQGKKDKKSWQYYIGVIKNKKTINKLDHPDLHLKLKQIIASKLQSRGIDIRLPGQYLKMVPDIDGRLGEVEYKKGEKAYEVLVPWSMFGKSRKEAEEFLAKMNEGDGLFVPGVRVPASDALSTFKGKVVGFTPGDANVTVLPHEFTVRSDADHDGDKVFVYKPDVTSKDGKTEIKDSKKNQVYQKIVELAGNKFVQNKRETGSIDLNVFESDIQEVSDERKSKGKSPLPKDFKFGGNSEMNDTDARMSFGGKAIGILAVAGKMNSVLYQAGVKFRKKIQIKVNGKLVDQNEIDANKTSNDIAMLLQAALDITKNPALLRSGINANNINVATAMLISGVELKEVINFLNETEIKEYYESDAYKNNSFVAEKGRDAKSSDLSKLAEEAKTTSAKENLRALVHFNALAEELNTITPIIQLDGGMPNTGVGMHEVKGIFKLLANPKSDTLLNYQEFYNSPMVQHYEKLMDLGIDIMSHHFITENKAFYKELEKIEASRDYSDVKRFNAKNEKIKVEQMFNLMVGQELLTEEQQKKIKEEGIENFLKDLESKMIASDNYIFTQSSSNSVNSFFGKVNDFGDVVDLGVTSQEAKNLYDSYLSKTYNGQTIGEYITEKTRELKSEGNFDANTFAQSMIDVVTEARGQEGGPDNAIGEMGAKKIVAVANAMAEYQNTYNSITGQAKELNENPFIRLVQVRYGTNEETGEQEIMLSGKRDIRFLTTIQKEVAKKGFEQLPIELQNDFKAYQLLKFGLSNKLGSLISIMPNKYGTEYLENISNIKHTGKGAEKVYNLSDYKIAQNYKDLHYPVKYYQKSEVKRMDDGRYMVVTPTGETIKGKPGVLFKVPNREQTFTFVKSNDGQNEVRTYKPIAQKYKSYTIFNNDIGNSLTQSQKETAKELDSNC